LFEGEAGIGTTNDACPLTNFRDDLDILSALHFAQDRSDESHISSTL